MMSKRQWRLLQRCGPLNSVVYLSVDLKPEGPVPKKTAITRMTQKRFEPLENMRVETRVLDQFMVVQLAKVLGQINALDVRVGKANGQVPGRDLGPILVLGVALGTVRVGDVTLGRPVAVLGRAHVRQPAALPVVVLAVLPDHLEGLVSLRGHLDDHVAAPSLDRGHLEAQGGRVKGGMTDLIVVVVVEGEVAKIRKVASPDL